MRSRGAGFIAQETQGEVRQHKNEGKEKGKKKGKRKRKGEKRKGEERYENKMDYWIEEIKGVESVCRLKLPKTLKKVWNL